ncbi:C40 family peptidase [Pedobacter flavus]|uniref:C40 family peptidase n=1 Tax=Pedobacter flavus TaxID=3113906 RepID=A0ABU7H2X1_9SPHI|nr:C40 family peptidase [Pedobacter sp. VNH31]MEE1885652.1 C40 family peptidase [Pedobacter sp. VNH31]
MLNKSYFLKFSLICLVFLASCGVRKPNTYKDAYAAKIAMAMANLKNKSLYNFITNWTGTPYKLGGFDKKGIDCSGFALQLQKQIYNKQLPRRSVDQSNVIKSKNLDKLKEGDLIFFSFGGKEIDHVGVFLNGNYFVHASTTRGVIVDDLSLPIYQKSLIKAGSIN